ncbi:hypothetical protein [Actinacidiphila rubida]|uniref:Uncharacterized protein n=1 Tax=Actinacidiphila rubida TaxID=310780 RepID=A0A1H8SX63_9ACTN|nr:hypothetical protein [Actinacidiphila rubida]SEO82773.1 hypothetical protein SAMN05216267_10467 [Actinacidiphila rubida]
MTGLLLLLQADSSAVVAATALGVAAHLQDSRGEIADSWTEGRAQISTWAQAATVRALVAASSVELCLLLHASPKRGGA